MSYLLLYTVLIIVSFYFGYAIFLESSESSEQKQIDELNIPMIIICQRCNYRTAVTIGDLRGRDHFRMTCGRCRTEYMLTEENIENILSHYRTAYTQETEFMVGPENVRDSSERDSTIDNENITFRCTSCNHRSHVSRRTLIEMSHYTIRCHGCPHIYYIERRDINRILESITIREFHLTEQFFVATQRSAVGQARGGTIGLSRVSVAQARTGGIIGQATEHEWRRLFEQMIQRRPDSTIADYLLYNPHREDPKEINAVCRMCGLEGRYLVHEETTHINCTRCKAPIKVSDEPDKQEPKEIKEHMKREFDMLPDNVKEKIRKSWIGSSISVSSTLMEKHPDPYKKKERMVIQAFAEKIVESGKIEEVRTVEKKDHEEITHYESYFFTQKEWLNIITDVFWAGVDYHTKQSNKQENKKI